MAHFEQVAGQSVADLAREYRERGYIKLSGLFDEQSVAKWQDECDRLQKLSMTDAENWRIRFTNPDIPYPEKIDPVADISPLFSDLIRDAQLESVLAAIFEDEAQLFKDKLIYKLPGMRGYSMHQDWAWGWQHLAPADDMLSVSFQIDGADEKNGCVELFAGYHDKFLTTPGEERNFNEVERKNIDPARGEKMITVPGDVLIFHSLTPHQSGENLVDYSRRSLYLTYNAKRSGDLRTEYYNHYFTHIAKGVLEKSAGARDFVSNLQ